MHIQPYLFFSGRCEEALKFYKKSLGAKIGMVMRFSDSPQALPPGTLQKGFEKKVMHAAFQLGSSTIFASDGCDDKSTFNGFSLSATVSTKTEANRVFKALAKGGSVQMPLAKTFWSPRYGMVTDKFGICWMVMMIEEEAKVKKTKAKASKK